MSEQEIQVSQVDGALAELVTRAEYDVQISTAKKYPRSIKQFMNQATELVTLNEDVADECIYALPRDGKTIEGPSARFAEIMLYAWGNSRAGARVVNEDAKFITSQGVCHDLQANTLIAFEVRRRITKSSGKKYSDDMIGTTANAASSIALRNAILKVIPKALWSPIYEEARKVVVGDVKTLSSRRQKALDHLQKLGASQEMVLKKLEVKGIEEITLDHLVVLRGIATAIKEGDATVEQIFAEEKVNTILNNLNEAIKSEKITLTFKDWDDEIRNSPSVEGVDFKLNQAREALAGDTMAIANLNLTANERKTALGAPVRGLFGKEIKPQENAA